MESLVRTQRGPDVKARVLAVLGIHLPREKTTLAEDARGGYTWQPLLAVRWTSDCSAIEDQRSTCRGHVRGRQLRQLDEEHSRPGRQWNR